MGVFTFGYLKLIAFIIMSSFLFQSCVVYHKQPTTLDQAIGSDKKKVKIITIDDKKLIFDSLYYKNDDLYGIMNKNKNLKQKTEVNIPIERIKSVHLLNIKKSRTQTILFSIFVPIGILGVIIIIAGTTASYNIHWSGSGGI
jgi:hypothetical protein